MRKIFSALALTVGLAVSLTGCTSAHDTAQDPAAGYWVTPVVNDKPVGDVYCIRSSIYSANAVDCQWSSLTGANTHKDTLQARGEYHYVTDAAGVEQKLLCINYVMRKGYRVINCNWESITNR